MSLNIYIFNFVCIFIHYRRSSVCREMDDFHFFEIIFSSFLTHKLWVYNLVCACELLIHYYRHKISILLTIQYRFLPTAPLAAPPLLYVFSIRFEIYFWWYWKILIFNILINQNCFKYTINIDWSHGREAIIQNSCK